MQSININHALAEIAASNKRREQSRQLAFSRWEMFRDAIDRERGIVSVAHSIRAEAGTRPSSPKVLPIDECKRIIAEANTSNAMRSKRR